MGGGEVENDGQEWVHVWRAGRATEQSKQASKHEVRQGKTGQAENGGNANSRDPWL